MQSRAIRLFHFPEPPLVVKGCEQTFSFLLLTGLSSKQCRDVPQPQ